MRWTLKLFGGAKLEREGAPVAGAAAQRQRLALLAVVASVPDGVRRERLLALLWPDAEPDRARHALANAVYSLRKALPEGALQSSGEFLRLDTSVVDADVVAFDRALRAGELEAAAALYDGPFLDGFSIGVVDFEHWVDTEQDRRARAFREAVSQLGEEAAARGAHGQELRWRRRAVDSDPMDTECALAFMRACIRAGDPVSAVRHARVHAGLLEARLELPPDPRVEALAAEAATMATSLEPSEEQQPEPARTSSTDTHPVAVPEPPAGGGDARARDPAAPAGPGQRGPTVRVQSGPHRAARVGAIALAVTALGLALLLARSGGATAEVERIAVLPLDNLSTDPEQAYFADAMTEVLTTELARIGGVEVVSRTSAQRYRGSELSLDEIAGELGVDALVEGSVFRSGDEVLITAQLVATAPERHVWADSYEGSVGDAISLQREVARSIAATIRQTVTGAPPVARPDEALDAYFLGIAQQQRFTAPSVREAVSSFERAVAIDTTFSDAWSKLAESYWMLAQPLLGIPHREGMAQAREAASTARALAPEDPLAVTVLGWVELFAGWDPDAAERLFRQAVRLAPYRPGGHAGLSFALSAQGRHDEAVAAARRARDLEPLVMSFRTSYAEILLYADRLEEAGAEIDRARAMDPDFRRTRTVGRWILEAREEWDEALRLATPDPPTADSVPRARESYWRWWLDRLESQPGTVPLSMAWAWAELGDAERALTFLEAAHAEGDGSMVLLDVAPQWDRIRDTRAFRDFRQRVW